jgi:RNA polymerase sigma-70 factor (family 1)
VKSEHTYSDHQLLLFAAAGDEQAFAQLFLRSKDKLYTYLIRLHASPQQTEDTIQDIFFNLWKSREKLMMIDNFDAYLFQAAHNQIINVFKKIAKERLALMNISVNAMSSDDEYDAIIDAQHLSQMVSSILQKLPQRQRLVFEMSRIEGLKHEEIAHKLQISPSTVNNHITQALKFIREQFQKNTPLPFDMLLIFVLLNG